MKYEVRTEIIPAHEIKKKVYIAEDGTEWLNELACLNHEEMCKILELPVFKYSIKGFQTFDEGVSMALYKIENHRDYDLLKSHLLNSKYERVDTDYEKYGPGWYMCWLEVGGDYNQDIRHLLNLNADIEERFKALKTYSESIQEAINNVEHERYNSSS